MQLLYILSQKMQVLSVTQSSSQAHCGQKDCTGFISSADNNHSACGKIYQCGPWTVLQGLRSQSGWASQGERAEFARTEQVGQSCIVKQGK